MKRMVDEKEVVKDIEATSGGILVKQLDGSSKTVPVSGSGGSVAWDDIQNKPNFATVATTGDYDDLTDKPTIPAAQVNSDWDAASGVAQILNKPSLATVATSGAYSDLSGTPTIPAAVSGTDDGTNWTSLTIGNDTHGFSAAIPHQLTLSGWDSYLIVDNSFGSSVKYSDTEIYCGGNNQYKIWAANHILIISEDGGSIEFGDAGHDNPTCVKLINLPTSDPQVAGQLWNDNGTLKVSSGI